MNNRVKSIVLFLSGIIAGITGTHLFTNSHINTPTHYGKPQTSTAILAASNVTETYYGKKLDSIAAVSEQLSRQANATKNAIRQEKWNYSQLQNTADTLVSRISTTSDTATKLQDCDSLAITVSDMMTVTARKDSLYDSLVNDLQEQVTLKDDGMQQQRQAYNALKLSLEQSVAQQDILHTENLLLKRNNHRQTVKNKVLYTGMIVLSGVLTYSIISH